MSELQKLVQETNDVIQTNTMSIESATQKATAGELASVAETLSESVKTLSLLVTIMKERAIDIMKTNKVKTASVTGWDGNLYTLELANSQRRSDIKRDDLVKAIERIAMDVEHRHDRNGEIISFEEALVIMLKSAFRFEPRWTEIKALGIDADEYCRTEYVTNVNIQKAVTL
jgi:hypothetical protein